ncbi:MAG: hypothetical protein KF726_25195 [Anaerolineae bacterium]|nr:hypothetical protein [Anaerolineae bacterium]
MWNRRASVVLLVCLGVVMTSCTTNTVLDVLVNPAEYYYVPLRGNSDTLSLCVALEKQGYILEQFDVAEIGFEVTYPDGSKRRYKQADEVSVIIIIDTNRDYANPNVFSSAEYARLEGLARTFFRDFQRIVNEQQLELKLPGVFYWDYFNGVRGGFRFSPDGEITDSYGWSTGSYANYYEAYDVPSCPSGRVIH